MFKQLLNIESAFKLSRMVTITVIICCTAIVIYNKYTTDLLIEKSREKIYVLDKGKALILALSQDMQQNRPVEGRNDIKMFHELFFNISPDAEAIKSNITRALALSDESVYNYYTDLRENNYYRRIIAANIIQRIKIDSIQVNWDTYPYQVKTMATEYIRRESNISTRSLVTTCSLIDVARSDDNPHGFLIKNFKIIENNDLSTEASR